jgi:hypothetical protein
MCKNIKNQAYEVKCDAKQSDNDLCIANNANVVQMGDLCSQVCREDQFSKLCTSLLSTYQMMITKMGELGHGETPEQFLDKLSAVNHNDEVEKDAVEAGGINGKHKVSFKKKKLYLT